MCKLIYYKVAKGRYCGKGVAFSATFLPPCALKYLFHILDSKGENTMNRGGERPKASYEGTIGVVIRCIRCGMIMKKDPAN